MISKTLTIFITSWIIENTEFDKEITPPSFFVLSQEEMSEKACYSSNNCRVKAYYVKVFMNRDILEAIIQHNCFKTFRQRIL